MTKIQRVKDKYNPNKIWVIYKTSSRHYFMQQEICGKLIGKKRVPTTKKHLVDIGIL